MRQLTTSSPDQGFEPDKTTKKKECKVLNIRGIK